MSDEQPKMKKKSSAAKLFARYKTYEGEAGSPDQWRAAAAVVAPNLDPALVRSLKALGLERLPSTAEELKKAHRQAIRSAHPDLASGSHDGAASINAAFDHLESLVPKPAPKENVHSAFLVTPARCTGDLPARTSAKPLRYAWPTQGIAVEEKINGERGVLYLGFDPLGRRHGTTLLSRQKSKFDGLFGDKTDQVPHITGGFVVDGTVLDGEVFARDWNYTHSVMGSTPGVAQDIQKDDERLVYHVFDIMFYKGQDVRKRPLSERRELLLEVVKELANPWIRAVTWLPGDPDATFERVTSAGGEGLVVKKLSSSYGQSWTKYKKCSDVSAFIIGYVEGKKALAGMVGSVEVGVYHNGSVHSVGCVSGFTNEQRVDITNNRQAYLGRVMDIFAFELTKADQILNPAFHRFRSDLNAEDCTLDKIKEDMKKMGSNRSKT